MKRTIKALLVGALSTAVVATSAVTLPLSASAQTAPGASGSYDVAQNWNGNRGPGWQGRQWRGQGPGWRGPARGPGWRGPGWRGPGARYRGWNGPGWYGGRYYRNSEAALAAGVIGLAAGAIIAGAANQQQRYSNTSEYIAYCSQRYRSFNPNTGFYTGYDGRQHRCIMK